MQFPTIYARVTKQDFEIILCIQQKDKISNIIAYNTLKKGE